MIITRLIFFLLLIFILFFKNRTNHKVNNNNKYYFGLLSRYSYHILLFDISAYYSCSNFTVLFDWDYPGNDINTGLSMTFPRCCSWCLSNSTCATYLNSTSECWIKRQEVLVALLLLTWSQLIDEYTTPNSLT